jgi:prepilin-type N-terminal cleavage/methylation domain-containing protein
MIKRNTTAGFTLIEVVVGLTVGGIVLLTGFAALGSVQDRSEHAAAATTAALEGATARATLIDWIAAAIINANALQVGFEGSDAREQGLISDELRFPTEAPTPRRVPTTAVRLFLDVDVNTAERGLVAEFVGMLGEQPRRLEIAPEAVGMSIRYLPISDTPVEWAESWIGQNQLPRAVEVILEDAPGEPLPPLLRFPIRVPLANAR